MRFAANHTKRKGNYTRLDAKPVGVGLHLEVSPRVIQSGPRFIPQPSRTKETFGGGYSSVIRSLGIGRASRLNEAKFQALASSFIQIPVTLGDAITKGQADQSRRVHIPIVLSRAVDFGHACRARLKERIEVLAMRLQRQQDGNYSECVFHGAHTTA